MSYATYNTLLAEFGEEEVLQLLDRDRDGQADTGVLQEALTFADAHLDGYLRERYTLPLATIPGNLIGIACDVVRYRLYQGQPTPLVKERYDLAIQFLRDIAKGLVTLDVDSETAQETLVAYSTPTTVFTRLEWD